MKRLTTNRQNTHSSQEYVHHVSISSQFNFLFTIFFSDQITNFYKERKILLKAMNQIKDRLTNRQTENIIKHKKLLSIGGNLNINFKKLCIEKLNKKNVT
jgi:hypothetical protein